MIDNKFAYFEHLNDMFNLGVSANAANTQLYDIDHQYEPIDGTPTIPYDTICYIQSVNCTFTHGHFIGLSYPLRLRQLIDTVPLPKSVTIDGTVIDYCELSINNTGRYQFVLEGDLDKKETSPYNMYLFYKKLDNDSIVRAERESYVLGIKNFETLDNKFYLGVSNRTQDIDGVKIYRIYKTNGIEEPRSKPYQIVLHKAIPLRYKPNMCYYSKRFIYERAYKEYGNLLTRGYICLDKYSVRYNVDCTQKPFNLSYAAGTESPLNANPIKNKYFDLTNVGVICNAPILNLGNSYGSVAGLLEDAGTNQIVQYFVKRRARRKFNSSTKKFERIEDSTKTVSGSWITVFKEDNTIKSKAKHASYIRVIRRYRGYRSSNAVVYRNTSFTIQGEKTPRLVRIQ